MSPARQHRIPSSPFRSPHLPSFRMDPHNGGMRPTDRPQTQVHTREDKAADGAIAVAKDNVGVEAIAHHADPLLRIPRARTSMHACARPYMQTHRRADTRTDQRSTHGIRRHPRAPPAHQARGYATRNLPHCIRRSAPGPSGTCGGEVVYQEIGFRVSGLGPAHLVHLELICEVIDHERRRLAYHHGLLPCAPARVHAVTPVTRESVRKR